MKQSNSCWAVNLTALVLAAGLLMGLFTGCFGLIGPKHPKPELKTEKVTITIKGDDGVTVNEPKTLEIAKDTKWSEIKTKVEEKLSYKTNYEAAGFRLDSESGSYLYDNYLFSQNETVFVLSKPELITITIKGDAKVIISQYGSFEVTKGIKWGDVKADVEKKVSYKICYEAAGFKLDSESGIDLKDDYVFKENKTVFVLSKKNDPSQPTNHNVFQTNWNGTITGYRCEKEDIPSVLVIPEKIGDEVITGIGYKAFEGCTSLTELKLPKSLSNIETDAFKDCTIETLSIKCDIDDSIFRNLTQEASVREHLKNITLEEGITKIDFRAFKNCSNLTGIILFPASIKSIQGGLYESEESGAFMNCTKLEGVDFSACTSLTGIDSYAFKDCIGLTNLDLSACTSLTGIGYKAFEGCTSLTELKLPKSLSNIETDAFKDCPIETLSIKCNIDTSISRNLTQEDSVKQHLKNVKLGAEVTNIDRDAFKGCTALINLMVDDDNHVYKSSDNIVYTKDGLKLVKVAGGLSTVNLLNTITKIEGSAFSGAKLESIDLSSCTNLIEIYWDAFLDCTELTGTIIFPTSLKSIGIAQVYGVIGIGIFRNCTRLEGIDFSACTELKEISPHAFYGCTSLADVKFPPNLTSIGRGAFYGCSKLSGTIVFPASFRAIYGCIKNDELGAFENCTKLEGVDFSACKTSYTEIGDRTFKGCTSLTDVKLPSYLKEIGKETFYGCTSLTEVNLPKNLIKIGEAAFEGCSNLTILDLSGCTHLCTITEAFKGCTGLTEIKLPANLSEIGDAAFKGCTSLTEVKMPANLSEIGDSAFKGCTSLTEVEMPAHLTKIGEWAFSGCTGLTSAVFRDTQGWGVYNNYYNHYIPISSAYLSNNATAAKYLREKYCYTHWKKN